MLDTADNCDVTLLVKEAGKKEDTVLMAHRYVLCARSQEFYMRLWVGKGAKKKKLVVTDTPAEVMKQLIRSVCFFIRFYTILVPLTKITTSNVAFELFNLVDLCILSLAIEHNRLLRPPQTKKKKHLRLKYASRNSSDERCYRMNRSR